METERPDRLYVTTFVTSDGVMVKVVSSDPHTEIRELSGDEAEREIQRERQGRA